MTEEVVRVWVVDQEWNDDWIRFGNRKKQEEELALHEKLAQEHRESEERRNRRSKGRRL